MSDGIRLLLIAVAMFVLGTDGYVLPALLPAIARSFGAEIQGAAQIVSGYSLCYALTIIPLAFVTSGWSYRTTFGIGLALFAAGCIASVAAPNLTLLLIARCCCGLGVAIVAPTAGAAAVAILPPDRRGRAIAIVMLSLSCAMAIGSPLGALIAAHLGWRATILVLAILAAVTLAALSIPQATWPARTSVEGLRPLLNDRLLQIGFLTAYLAFVGLYCVYIYLGVVFDRATSSNASMLSLLLWVWGIAGVAGSAGAAWLCDRLGAKKLVALCLLGLAVNFAMLPLTSQTLGSALAVVALWGAIGVVLSISLQRQLIESLPEQVALLSACFVCALQIGIATAGLLGGALFGRIGAYDLPLLGSAFIVAALLTQCIAASAAIARWSRRPA